MYVVIKRNGTALSGHSTEVVGWDVDFPMGDEDNHWPITIGTPDRYSIEIWDSNWGRDDQIVTITGLTGQSFRSMIYENGARSMSKDRLVKVTFVEESDSTPSSVPEVSTPR